MRDDELARAAQDEWSNGLDFGAGAASLSDGVGLLALWFFVPPALPYAGAALVVLGAVTLNKAARA